MNCLKTTPTLLLFSFFFANASFAEDILTSKTVKCWEAAIYDKDGDGFANSETGTADIAYIGGAENRETFTVLTVSYSESIPSEYDPILTLLRLVRDQDKMTCPTGWVRSRGDCNDDPDEGGADVFPRRNEVYGNGRDDNCNDLVDEPDLIYSPSGHNNQTNKFDIPFFINDPEIKNVKANPWVSLKVEVEYQKLSNTNPETSFSSGLKSLKSYVAFGSITYGKVELDNLDPTTVYRARVQFYKTSRRRVGGLPIKVGHPSNWYYSTTDGQSSISKARTKALLQGFYQYYEGNHRGLVGYKGAEDIDGTRYGADQGEAWCSEFYSWVTDHTLAGMGHRNNVSKMMDYFNEHDAGIYNPTNYQVKNKIKRGDYLGEDTTGDDDKNHSAMFLDYDTYRNVIWTLDGNSVGYNEEPGLDIRSRAAGNEATIRVRPVTYEVKDEDDVVTTYSTVRYWGRFGKSPLK
ncbi:MAG: hypothetical protein CMH56_01055 [Myxococcales bacterium]|nr:hypothetical protein [Myxococcales bacterium]|tara:strand:+ start:2535 stop:3920 length:1386 start_codon:yes stop_codon:yes gene_type:complete